MYKRLSIIMAALAITNLFLAACRAATPIEIDCTKAEVLCVGMVTGLDGVNDKSFNQSTWEGLMKAQNEKIADRVLYIETVDAKDYEMNITTLVGDGYDIVVTVGDLQSELTASAAKNFPDILFIGVDQRQADVSPNLVGLVFHDDQSGYLAGALAAQMTRTNTIAAVLGTDTIPSVVAFKEGFEAGARSINPSINIISSYYPGNSEVAFTDPRWGASTAAQAIQNGADVIFSTSGKTGYGALIETARYPGLYCIGIDTDQWETLPEAHSCLISSTIKLIGQGVYEIIKLTKDGTFPTGSYFGASGLAPYHDFDSAIPQAVKDSLIRITAGLSDGSLTTGDSPGK